MNKVKNKKGLNIIKDIFMTLGTIILIELILPIGALGNMQYYWWLLLLVLFYFPFSLINAEIKTTYSNTHNLIKNSLGYKWISRVEWNRLVSYSMWTCAITIALTQIISAIFKVELNFIALIAIELVFLFGIVLINSTKIKDNTLLIKVSSCIKYIFMVSLFILGICVLIKNGDFVTSSSKITSVSGLTKLSFLSVIVYAFLKFDLVENNEKDRKKTYKLIIVYGVIVALIYMLAVTGLNVSIKTVNVNASNITESFVGLLSSLGAKKRLIEVFSMIIGLMFIYTSIINVTTIYSKVISDVEYSAKDGTLPSVFKNNNITAVIYSLMSAILLIVLTIFRNSINVFWTLLSLSIITLLVSYIPTFILFLKLRKEDKTSRVFKVPGNKLTTYIIGLFPLLIIILSVLFTIFGDFSSTYVTNNVPLLIIICILFTIEEVIVSKIENK